MGQLHSLILHCSHTPRAFISVVAAFAFSLFAILRFSHAFQLVTRGYEPFDMQSQLIAADMLKQLPAYTDASRNLYWMFMITDFIFPFLGALFVAALGAFFVRGLTTSLYKAIVARNGFIVLMSAMVFDWLENVATLSLVFSYPPASAPYIDAILLFKQLKSVTLLITQGGVIVLGVVWLVAILIRRIKPKT